MPSATTPAQLAQEAPAQPVSLANQTQLSRTTAHVGATTDTRWTLTEFASFALTPVSLARTQQPTVASPASLSPLSKQTALADATPDTQ